MRNSLQSNHKKKMRFSTSGHKPLCFAHIIFLVILTMFPLMSNAINDSSLPTTVNEERLDLSGADKDNFVVWYVNINSTGIHNGQSWETAFIDIQSAVDTAYSNGGGEVWVAQGTYSVSEAKSGIGLYVLDKTIYDAIAWNIDFGEDKENTGIIPVEFEPDNEPNPPVLTMKPGVHLFAGFTGVETIRSEARPASNPTILDGENVRRCVIGAENATLHGFHLYRGQAKRGAGIYNEGVSPTISSCVFKENNAVGINGAKGCDNCHDMYFMVWFRNYAGGDGSTGGSAYGGSVYSVNTDLDLVNCLLINNSASGGAGGKGGNGYGLGGNGGNGGNALGGAVYGNNSNIRMVNCTLSGNKAVGGTRGEGGTYLLDAFPNPGKPGIAGSAKGGTSAVSETGAIEYINCILWNSSPDLIDSISATQISYSNIQGGFSGTGNIAADPMFRSAEQENYRLAFTSPCINSGTDINVPVTDIDGTLRPQGDGVDMGAYEVRLKTLVPNLVGLTAEEAGRILSNADLEVGEIDYEYSDSVPEGSIINQGLLEGEETTAGNTVTLVISLGPAADNEGEGESDDGSTGCCSSNDKTLSPVEFLNRMLGDWLIIGMSLITIFAISTLNK